MTGPVRIRYAAKTDVGLKRTHNEDCFSLVEEEQLFLVADGMGGHASGEVASRLATEIIGEFYHHSKDEDATWPFRYDKSRSHVENRMVASIRLANVRIHELAQTTARLRGMGTTIVGFHAREDRAYVAHVGDSRCYRVRNGSIQLLTRDHSLLEDYREARPDMTDEEARNFPHKNVITRALGMRDVVDVDIKSHALASGDRFVLCSDGLSGMLEDGEIHQIVSKGTDLEKTAVELIDRANSAGGTDNITVMVLECTT